MSERGVTVLERLRTLDEGAELRMRVADAPLDEILLTFHESRFTGAAYLFPPPDMDRIYFREGAVVGVVPRRQDDARLLGQALLQLKLVSAAELERLNALLKELDGVSVAQRLANEGVVPESQLERVFAEQARRRLFELYDVSDAPLLVQQGIERLSHFFATYVDVRPAIAFGLVVRSSDERRQEMVKRVASRRVRLVAPYDRSRNSYGLPPPVLGALQILSEQGARFDAIPRLPGLSSSETAGLLLLMERMSLLRIED